ncbi:MAG: histidinol-phosphate transaminase [Candidatus Altiarchaeota archaeon]
MDVKDCIRPNVLSLPDYVPGEFREGFIKLASNENNFGPSPKVVEVLREWSGRTQLYPYRSDEVRGKVAEYAGVGKENIALGNGSDELMDMLVKVFEGPVAGSYPSFAEYPIAAGAMGEKYVPVKLGGDFTFDARRFLKEAGDCRLAFLCSPNNPTGLSIPDSDVKAVLDDGKVVVLDEAYYEFSGKSRVGWVRDYPNLIVLRTLSKAFALAGLRVGYAVADPIVVRAMLKVKLPFNLSSLAEAASVAALDDLGYMRWCVNKIVAGRESIYKALSSKFKPYPSDSNFIFADVTPMTSQEFFDRMVERKIIVREFGKLKGFKGEYIRVSAGTVEENKEFVKAISSL